ncbi:MAG: DUF3604 domain-containing protein [Thermoanaerobaculia bacterium]
MAIGLCAACSGKREEPFQQGPTPEETLESAFTPLPVRVSPGSAPGQASVTPSRFEVEEVGRYVLEFEVGEGGIGTGGGLLVDFPKAWFASLVPLSKPFQIRDQEAPHFASVEASRVESQLQLRLEREGLDGKLDRFPHIIHVTVAGSPLAEGDEILVTLANTSAPFVSGPDEVRVAVDTGGTGEFRFIEMGAEYEVVSDSPAEIYLLGASHAVVGRPHELQVTLFDRFFNPTVATASRLVVEGLQPNPLAVRFSTDDPWRAVVRWTPTEVGFYWPRLSGSLTPHEGAESQSIELTGDPVLASSPGEPVQRTYWGDIQSHSAISKDGIGHLDYIYARDVTRLDFYASTEHSDDDGSWEEERDGITPEEWRQIQERVRGFYDPGSFVTLLGYECTLRHGHHCIYFRQVEGAPIPPRQVDLIENLWRLLPEGDAITIPHHLGRLTGPVLEAVEGPELEQLRFGVKKNIRRGPVLNWSHAHEQTFRPILEIFSIHGTSELLDPEDPLAYEHSDFLPSKSAHGKHYARDAWAAGHRMGVVASSDNHVAHPGLRHTGLAAVIAPELSREAVFRALTTRSTYGTTGVRIFMRFAVAGAPMGAVTQALGRVSGSVTVAAPGEIRHAEVVALDTGSSEWRVAARWERPGRLLETDFEDTVGDEGSTYYLRVELQEPTNGRPARGWSSPVWVDPLD